MTALTILSIIGLWTIIGGLIYTYKLWFGNARLLYDSRWIILACGPPIWIARLSVKLYWGI
ncbi:hypothetical protein LCGC14_1230710 [marine sediment metagenome]|uniref:Uncharacterized protein n=1 Tax=marine sediment metagenome TaxID=412755 RepID=A0A0F9LCP9_9ZZZZ